MSLRTAARFARRELRGGLSGFRIFLACLALGVAAISGVGSVRSAIEAGLTDQGARVYRCNKFMDVVRTVQARRGTSPGPGETAALERLAEAAAAREGG